MVLRIKFGYAAIGVSCAVAGTVFGISPKPGCLESELQDSKAVSNV